MFRFDRLIRSSMTVREIRTQYPETAAVFESLRFRDVCDDCTLGVVVKKQGLSLSDVMDALQLSICKGQVTNE